MQFAWIPLVLFGFHNSLNTNPKRSGTLDFILTFEQLAWILSWFVWLLSHSSWLCMASTIRLIQIQGGAKHRISFLCLCRSSLQGFSWFCMASFPQLQVLFGFHNSLNTNPMRGGTSDFILTFVQEQSARILLVLSGFFPTAPGFVWLPQLA